MAIRPILLDDASPFLGEACALCKQSFTRGDQLAICPDDATRHHVHCWQANNNHCTAYGCGGQGSVSGKLILSSQHQATIRERNNSKTLPERSFGCAQSCLLLAIAVAIVLFAIGCFGLWAIADYFVTDILQWSYRQPIAAGCVQMVCSTLFLL